MDERIRLHLLPLEASFFPINSDIQIVLFTVGDLTILQNPLRAVIEAEQHVSVVVEEAAFYKDTQVGTDF